MQRTNILLGDLLDIDRFKADNFASRSDIALTLFCFVTRESRGFKDFKYDIDYHLVTTKTKTKKLQTHDVNFQKAGRSKVIPQTNSTRKFPPTIVHQKCIC